MEQFIQSRPNLQQQFVEFLGESSDILASIPQGMAWFDAFPVVNLLNPKSLSVVVYPNQSLLKNHVFRLKLMGLGENDFAAFTNDLPPHAEREIWEQVNHHQLPLLLMTAKKLQSLNTLSQLIQHPYLGPIILEQGHIAIPGLWGPVSYPPYEGLSELFNEQWKGRPPLFVFHQPLSQPYQNILASNLGLDTPQTLDLSRSLDAIQLTVKRCLTAYQKLKALMEFMNRARPDVPKATVVVCHSVKEINQLAQRLQLFDPIAIHHHLDAEERELQWMELMHRQDVMVILESSLFAEFPVHLFPFHQLQVIHWQMPWSLESLIQQTTAATHPNTQYQETLVLYTKEDYASQKQWLGRQLCEEAALKPIHRDQLNRVRHFCCNYSTCRGAQLANVLYGWQLQRPVCGKCDICLNPQNSSLWRNLLNPFLF